MSKATDAETEKAKLRFSPLQLFPPCRNCLAFHGTARASNMLSETIVNWLASRGALNIETSGVLALVFILGAFLPAPRTFLLIGVGAIYGLAALVIIIPSATLGNILAFLLARGLLRNFFQRQTDKRPTWKAVLLAVDSDGWKIVALFRFFGPLPNAIQNYIFGLTGIRLLPFSLATLVFGIPQLVLYVYIGGAGRSVMLEGGPSLLSNAPFLLAGIVMAAVTFRLARRARSNLRGQC